MNLPPDTFRESEVRLLPANPAEAGEIESMAKAIWPAAYGDIISQAQIEFMLQWMYSPAKVISEMTLEGISYDWISSGDTKAGFIATSPSQEAETVYRLHKFYLLPERQGQGLGSSAMELLINRLIQSGTSRLELRVNRNNAAAVAFYRKNNFEIHATDCRDIGGGFVMDDFLMRRHFSQEPGSSGIRKTIR